MDPSSRDNPAWIALVVAWSPIFTRLENCRVTIDGRSAKDDPAFLVGMCALSVIACIVAIVLARRSRTPIMRAQTACALVTLVAACVVFLRVTS
jgi:hypothetical protein